ncbi:MAG: type II/IV secretion system protein [Ignavibacteriales bacterium]|jgi:type IV pilus assembly protein PilB|nr:type II/IV secretion system protein [Ignavibacteriales bacterium]MBP9123591.1 type II/IV secretion system protein [Ignavibacteriaceae bacterium]
MVDPRLETADKIGYTLLRKGIIDVQTLEKALDAKANDVNKIKRNLAQILVEDFKYDHDTVFAEVASLYAFRDFDTIAERYTDEKIEELKKYIKSLPDSLQQLMSLQKVIPLLFDPVIKDKMILGAVDPTNKKISKIAFDLKAKKYEVTFIKKAKYEKLVSHINPVENEFLKNIEDLPQEMITDTPDDSQLDEEALEAEINKSALINLIEAALVEGTRKGVSDIHIVPAGAKRTDLMFRIDGNLQIWYTQENTYPEAVIAVIKDRAKGLDRFEREKAQDGFIQREIDGTVIRFRVSILPMVGTELKSKFESVVIRILDDRKVITDLNKLGLAGYARTAFDDAIRKPQGMIILTGPTGSGKSTTLVAALYQVIDPTVNVLTVEDPVEYVIKGARQLKIGHKMNFEQAIRAILRHDPDIVLVGEMRDKETAEVAIKLANTGHLTFSTLHTNDAPSAVSRLYKMGIEPFLIAYAINIIVAQRLIRRLCVDCKRKMTHFDHAIMELLGLDEEEWKQYDVYEPVGCPKCSGSGYKGRIAIHEALYFTKDLKRVIVSSGEEVDEERLKAQAKKDGSLNLRETGLEKVKLGMTSFDEVITGTMED